MALRAAQAEETKAENQRWVDPRDGKVLFKDYVVQRYEPVLAGLEKSTRNGHASKLKVHLLPMWGDRALSSIKPSEVQAWVADANAIRDDGKQPDMRLARTPAMTRHVHSLFHTIMTWAVRDSMVPSNPAGGIHLPTAVRPQVIVMTPDTFSDLHAAIEETQHRRMFLTAVRTGMRWSELVGLTPRQVDFPRGRVTIDRCIVRVVKAQGSERWDRKPYPKGRLPRHVQVAPDVLEALAGEIAKRGLDALSEEPIFVTRHGNPMDSSAFTRLALQPALERAGIETRYTMKHLRSSYCSWLIEGGAPLHVVQAMMGHAAITTTQKYIGVLPEAEEQALTALSKVLHRQKTGMQTSLLSA